MDVVADRVQFLSRGEKTQAEVSATEKEETPAVSAKGKALAGSAGGGWGHAVKQLQDKEDGNGTDFGEEDFKTSHFEGYY